MFYKTINTQNITLHLYDTTRNSKNQLKITKNLSVGLKTLEEFFWSDDRKCLGPNLTEVKHIIFDMTICGEHKIKSLNTDYRKKPKITDVLSFPLHQSLRKGKRKDLLVLDNTIELGDIFICRSVAEKQAKEFGISPEREIIHLLIHGLLHLCGYDHEVSDSEEKLMFNLEKVWVKKFFADF